MQCLTDTTATLLAHDSAGPQVSRSAGQRVSWPPSWEQVSWGPTRGRSDSGGHQPPPGLGVASLRGLAVCRLPAGSQPPPGIRGFSCERQQAAEWDQPQCTGIFKPLRVSCFPMSLWPNGNKSWPKQVNVGGLRRVRIQGERLRAATTPTEQFMLSKHKNQPSLNITCYYSTLGAGKGHCGKLVKSM